VNNSSQRLPPGHYVVTHDPSGELSMFGLRMRIIERRPDRQRPSPVVGTRRVPVQILLIVAALARKAL